MENKWIWSDDCQELMDGLRLASTSEIGRIDYKAYRIQFGSFRKVMGDGYDYIEGSCVKIPVNHKKDEPLHWHKIIVKKLFDEPKMYKNGYYYMMTVTDYKPEDHVFTRSEKFEDLKKDARFKFPYIGGADCAPQILWSMVKEIDNF